jgi:hypothetical protein
MENMMSNDQMSTAQPPDDSHDHGSRNSAGKAIAAATKVLSKLFRWYKTQLKESKNRKLFLAASVFLVCYPLSWIAPHPASNGLSNVGFFALLVILLHPIAPFFRRAKSRYERTENAQNNSYRVIPAGLPMATIIVLLVMTIVAGALAVFTAGFSLLLPAGYFLYMVVFECFPRQVRSVTLEGNTLKVVRQTIPLSEISSLAISNKFDGVDMAVGQVTHRQTTIISNNPHIMAAGAAYSLGQASTQAATNSGLAMGYWERRSRARVSYRLYGRRKSGAMFTLSSGLDAQTAQDLAHAILTDVQSGVDVSDSTVGDNPKANGVNHVSR